MTRYDCDLTQCVRDDIYRFRAWIPVRSAARPDPPLPLSLRNAPGILVGPTLPPQGRPDAFLWGSRPLGFAEPPRPPVAARWIFTPFDLHVYQPVFVLMKAVAWAAIEACFALFGWPPHPVVSEPLVAERVNSNA